MLKITPNTTIRQYQDFIRRVYGFSNDRHFSAWDMLTNVERFIMRGLKGIRKKDKEKIKINLIIASSWFVSLMGQLHIDIEEETWKRFPNKCSYCSKSPCVCKIKKTKKRETRKINAKKRPKTMADFQKMFAEIYPAQNRTLEDAGIHLAEEIGEMSEAFLFFKGNHKNSNFESIKIEAADIFSCIMAVFNSLNMNMAKELANIFKSNCHVCGKAPCACDFENVVKFKS